ncbi:MAG: hypothetical protein MJE77_05515 [Proteobacteria bacterium]|nr:hypothetical protein [Pseudomonadota bacterium]
MAAVFGLLVAAPGAWAQHWSIHAVGSASTSFTDNVANDADEEDPEAAITSQITPAVLFTFESPRTIHVASLRISATQHFFTDDVPEPISGTLTHDSLFRTSQTTELGLGANAGLGQVNTLLGEAGGEQQQAQPEGDTTFRSVGLNQRFRWDFTSDWSFNQAATGTQVITDRGDNETSARSLGNSLGLSRTWARTAAGITGSVALIETSIEPDGAETLRFTSGLSLNVRRDLNPRWSANGEFGVATVTTLEADNPAEEGTAATPSGALSLNYFRPIGSVIGVFGASVGHRIAPNLFLGTVTRTGSGVLRASIPLPWFRREQTLITGLSSTLGLSKSWTVGAGMDQDASWYVVTADVAARWSPADAWDVTLRYQLISQSLDVVEMNAQQVPADFTRNTIMLVVSGRWPTRQAAVIPDRRNLRVDRANEEISDDGELSDGPGSRR